VTNLAATRQSGISKQPILNFVAPARRLNDVLDPEIGLSVIQLGLIRNFRLDDDGQAIVKMILTTPFCPYGPALIDMTRVKAEEAIGKPVSIELGMDVWDFAMMEEGVDLDWGLY